MSVFDGTTVPLTFGEALGAIAQRTPWQSEQQRDEVLAAIAAELGDADPDNDEGEETPEPEPVAARPAKKAAPRKRR